MRLPIRNKSARKLTVFMEPLCDQYEVPAGGEAIIRLEDGPAHSIDVDGDWVTIWDEGRVPLLRSFLRATGAWTRR